VVAASAYMIVFRIVHVVASIAWGGSVVMLVFFLQPSAAAIGPAAGPFMGELLGKRRLTNAILGMAMVSIIGGLFLYWHDWHLFESFSDWVTSRWGFVLTIGAVAAIAAFLIGLLATKPRMARMMAMSRQAAEAGGPPPPELVALQTQLKMLARSSLALIGVAAIAMATARYW
jgi:uncharacterized membrane protein